MKVAERWFEEYEIGESRTTVGRTITEADIVLHAGQTGDFFPHHLDAEWMSTQPAGQRIAHGTLILSVAVGMTAGDINPRSMSYGYDKIRFIKPVFIGDTIHSKVVIAAKSDDKKPEFGQVVEHVEVFNQHGQIVLACDHLLLARKKNPGTTQNDA